jgi:hypothetical protein
MTYHTHKMGRSHLIRPMSPCLGAAWQTAEPELPDMPSILRAFKHYTAYLSLVQSPLVGFNPERVLRESMAHRW